MRLKILIASLVSLFVAATWQPATFAAPAPPERFSALGQIVVLTVNARQVDVLGLNEFLRLFHLSRAIRSRVPALDGGFDGAVVVPDVLLLQEMRPSNLEILRNLLNQRFSTNYEFVGPENRDAAILINRETIIQTREVEFIDDPCVTSSTPLPGNRTTRRYPIAHLNEKVTNLEFIAVAVHFSKNYRKTGQSDCLHRNIIEMRSRLDAETVPIVVGGDFNQRPVETVRECDLDELSPPLPWWQELTAPSSGRVYVDAVRESHRARGESLVDEWTHEREFLKVLCTGSEGFRRGRIDYLFSTGAAVAEAHADHPGWAGEPPGVRDPVNFKYSDHRFVWGRFVLAGPPQPAAPTTAAQAGGVVELSWAPAEGIASWLLLRAVEGHAYAVLATLPPESMSFSDGDTVHRRTYRYALAPLDGAGQQGAESLGSLVTIDARGPQAIGFRPFDGSIDVEVRPLIAVRLDERVDPLSVTDESLRVYRGNHRVGGQVVIQTRRFLVFDPFRPLRKGERYRVVALPLRDELGNRGERAVWRFRTEEPRRKRK